MSEVHNCFKNLPGGLHLERCSQQFESRGFRTLGSLKYLRPGDIDAFFPSPEKLLLAEKRILESEIKAIVGTDFIFVVIKDVARAAKPRVTSRRAQRAGERSGPHAGSLRSPLVPHLLYQR